MLMPLNKQRNNFPSFSEICQNAIKVYMNISDGSGNLRSLFILESNFYHFTELRSISILNCEIRSHPIPVILVISCEIMQSIVSFTLRSKKNRENCHSLSSWLMQMVKRYIMFMLDSRKFWSGPITNAHILLMLLLK